MRSRLVIGSVVLVLVLAVVSTCRQRSASVSADRLDEATLPTDSPSPAAATPAAARSASRERAQSADEDGREVVSTATLTAEDPDAEITVRSLPSQTSEPLGYGRVDESVTLGRTETDAVGDTWYYVTFQNDATAGWVRSDLLTISTPAPTESATARPATQGQAPSDTLKRSLDETCGGNRAIESYFVTPSNTIYICKVRNQRTYLSQEAGTEQVVIAKEVEALGGGYIVSNGDFEYRLDSGSLVVVRLDDSGRQEEILRENVIYTERY